MNCNPSFDSHRRDLIKYAALTNTSILDLRNNLADSYDNPVFDFPVFCSTKYLNRVALSNAKRVLDTFRRSHNNGKSKSKYQPLATGYSVYHYFHQAPQSNVRFKDVSRDLYLSQFYPPPPDNSEGKNMVGFSHLNNVRHQGPGFGSPSAVSIHSSFIPFHQQGNWIPSCPCYFSCVAVIGQKGGGAYRELRAELNTDFPIQCERSWSDM